MAYGPETLTFMTRQRSGVEPDRPASAESRTPPTPSRRVLSDRLYPALFIVLSERERAVKLPNLSGGEVKRKVQSNDSELSFHRVVEKDFLHLFSAFTCFQV